MNAVVSVLDRLHRDATFSRKTRDDLVTAGDALRTLAAIQDEIADSDGIDVFQAARRVFKHCADADPAETRALAQAIDDVVDQWDTNGTRSAS